MKRKRKMALAKRKICICLIAGMAISSITACGVQAHTGNQEDKEVIVLENQQQDIDNVLAIKKIDKIEGLQSRRWLDEENIIGIIKKDGIENICIYNINEATTKVISNNAETSEMLELKMATKPILNLKEFEEKLNYVLYTKKYKSDDKEDKGSVYAINLKDFAERKLEDGVNAISKIDDNKVVVSKGMKLYMCDLINRTKDEIKIPKEMENKLKDFSWDFEEYYKFNVLTNEDVPEEAKQNRELIKHWQERYKYEKENNHIWQVAKEGDDIYIKSYNKKPFKYNLKTHEYREEEWHPYNRRDDSIVAWLNIETNDPADDELWVVDSDGKQIELIEKGFIQSTPEISPDNTKVAYTIFDENFEKKTFIYDIESGKKISIFEEVSSGIYWNKDSNKFMFFSVKIEGEDRVSTTNIVTLN